MVLPPKPVHPEGEQLLTKKNLLSEAIEVEIYAGKLHIVHIEWDPDAAVPPQGERTKFRLPSIV